MGTQADGIHFRGEPFEERRIETDFRAVSTERLQHAHLNANQDQVGKDKSMGTAFAEHIGSALLTKTRVSASRWSCPAGVTAPTGGRGSPLSDHRSATCSLTSRGRCQDLSLPHERGEIAAGLLFRDRALLKFVHEGLSKGRMGNHGMITIHRIFAASFQLP